MRSPRIVEGALWRCGLVASALRVRTCRACARPFGTAHAPACLVRPDDGTPTHLLTERGIGWRRTVRRPVEYLCQPAGRHRQPKALAEHRHDLLQRNARVSMSTTNAAPGPRCTFAVPNASHVSIVNTPERGAGLARREDRAYREYARDEQRSQPGCPARRIGDSYVGQDTRACRTGSTTCRMVLSPLRTCCRIAASAVSGSSPQSTSTSAR
jgi:hypothetical protein